MKSDEQNYYELDTLKIDSVGEWRQIEPKIVLFPKEAVSAKEIQFYMKGDPPTANYRYYSFYFHLHSSHNNFIPRLDFFDKKISNLVIIFQDR